MKASKAQRGGTKLKTTRGGVDGEVWRGVERREEEKRGEEGWGEEEEEKREEEETGLPFLL